jgi:hypothetical protein
MSTKDKKKKKKKATTNIRNLKNQIMMVKTIAYKSLTAMEISLVSGELRVLGMGSL